MSLWEQHLTKHNARVAQRWSTSLPRRGSRVRFPSRALKKETDWWNTNRSLFFEPCRGSKVRCLHSAPVVARPTSPGRCATSRAQYCISGFVSRLPARSAFIFSYKSPTLPNFLCIMETWHTGVVFDVIISLGNCETRKNSKRKAGDKLSLVTSGELGSAVEMQWKYSGNAKCSVKTAR